MLTIYWIQQHPFCAAPVIIEAAQQVHSYVAVHDGSCHAKTDHISLGNLPCMHW
jgi:hypothetical protein